MKILVIEDNLNHVAAAIFQLAQEHDLCCARSPAEAMKFFDAATEDGIPYEVVLCDLVLKPDSHMTLGSKRVGAGEYVPQEEALGWPFLFMAVQHGARYVALVSELDHHAGPHAACVEEIHGGKRRPTFDQGGSRSEPQFTINGARVGIFPASLINGMKNWKVVLERLLEK